jgi:phage head maturation protease
MSFGFYVGQDSWNKSDAGNIRTIEEISRLVDISLVTIPAYPQTSASVRSLLNNIDKEEERKDNVQVRKNKLKMLKLKK